MSKTANVNMNGKGRVINKQDDKDKLIKQVLQSPELTNTAVIESYKKNLAGDKISVSDILDSLQQSSEQLQGDTPLSLAESILVSQAQSLNAIFCDMAIRANRQEYMANMDKLLKLALKAQSQCRATLETLANIKNPPIVFAKQANIAHHQQINNQQVNHTAQSEQASESSTQPQEALEHTPSQAIPKLRAKKVAIT